MSCSSASSSSSSYRTLSEIAIEDQEGASNQLVESVANDLSGVTLGESSESKALENRAQISAMPDEVLIFIFKCVIKDDQDLKNLSLVSKCFEQNVASATAEIIVRKKEEIKSALSQIENGVLEDSRNSQTDAGKSIVCWIESCRQFLEEFDFKKPPLKSFKELNKFWEDKKSDIIAQIYKSSFELIRKFPEEIRFGMAKVLAAQCGWTVSQFIERYELKESHRFEVAKIAACQSGEAISLNIKNYKLSNEADRLEVAKIAVAQDGDKTSNHIGNYGLEELHLFEVAKVSAVHNGEGTSIYIQRYALAENHRFEVAKLAAAQNGVGTSEHIKNYELSNEADRLEVAKIAVAQNHVDVPLYFDNYDLNWESQVEIFRMKK